MKVFYNVALVKVLKCTISKNKQQAYTTINDINNNFTFCQREKTKIVM